MGELVKMKSTRAIKARAKAVAAEAQAEPGADLGEAKPYKEWTPYDLCCEGREIAVALQGIAFDGKIDRAYVISLCRLYDEFDTFCNQFCSDDGWGDNYTTDHDLELLQREREQLERRIQHIDDTLSGREDDQPA